MNEKLDITLHINGKTLVDAIRDHRTLELGLDLLPKRNRNEPQLPAGLPEGRQGILMKWRRCAWPEPLANTC